MRTYLLIALLALSVAALSACTNNAEPEADSDAATGPTPTLYVNSAEESLNQGSPSPAGAQAEGGEQAEPQVLITDRGFDPPTVTVSRGTEVVFENRTNRSVQPASDPHPQHTDYPGFDSESGLAPNQQYRFRFDQAGEWGMHDHLRPTNKGSIIVTE